MEIKALNDVDRGYQYLLSEVMTNGKTKNTRSGKTKSIFGKQFKVDLKKGFPLLTTKKVFVKGAIHELLWFLQRPCNSHGSSNIEYLVRNDIHIWDGDAFRWLKEWVIKEIASENKEFYFLVADGDDELNSKIHFEWWIENEIRKNDIHWLLNLEKDEFLDLVLQKVEIRVKQNDNTERVYRFGDLGPVYGKQWRKFDGKGKTVDQIKNIVETLKRNPDDRRMVCTAYNPSVLQDVALPPCHVMMQFYTRKLSKNERWELYRKKFNIDVNDENGISKQSKIYDDATNPFIPRKYKEELNKELDEERIPVYGLSCMWTQRSCDLPIGFPINLVSYSLLTCMIGKIVNMEPDMVIASIGDCHIYENQFDGVKEQLSREGSRTLPTLVISGNHTCMEDFKYEDFEFVGYEPNPIIKFPLSVG